MLCPGQRVLASIETQMLSSLHDLEVKKQISFSCPASSPDLPLCLFLKSASPKDSYKIVC